MTFWSRLSIPGDPLAVYGMVGIALVLSIWLVRIAWSRPNKRWRRTRMIATATAISSLLLLGLRPHLETVSTGASEALLVTEGASPDQIEALADSLGSAMPVFSTIDASPWSSRFSEITRIPDAAYLARHHPDVTQVLVAGYGLPAYEWEALPRVQAIPLLPPTPVGFQTVRWPSQVVLGQTFAVSGRVAGIPDGQLYLEGSGGVQDSVAVTGDTAVTLRAKPGDIGRFAYRLRFVPSSEEGIIEESVLVSVLQPPRLSILVVEASPRFETRYFKDWFAGQSGRMAIRSTISDQRFRFDFVNLPEVDLNRITPGLLSRFDVLFIDGATLRSLEPAERAAIRDAVRQTGLGIFLGDGGLRPGDSGLPESDGVFFQPVRLVPDPEMRPRTVDPQWAERPDTTAPALPAAPFLIDDATHGEVLMTARDGSPVAIAVDRGRGKIAISLVEETFRWTLQEHADTYGAYWSHILSTLARPDDAGEVLWPRNAPLLIDQPVPLTLVTDDLRPKAFLTYPDDSAEALAVRQNTALPWRWSAVFWPRNSGWHRLTAGESDAWFYVYPDSAWESVERAGRILATARHTSRPLEARIPGESESTRSSQPIPPLGFFLLFLCSSAFLWLERRL